MNVSDIGKAIAHEIETRGHFQGGYEYDTESACLVANNPAYDALSGIEKDEFFAALSNKVVGLRGNLGDIYRWNDYTPTEIVLKTLRNL